MSGERTEAAGMPERVSEIFGARERPYDKRWGTPEQVRAHFGLSVAALKAAWMRGWVRARQGNWVSDKKRTQTVYCFEDIHGWLERVAHQVSEAYAGLWWTDETVVALEEKMSKGPYFRPGGGGQTQFGRQGCGNGERGSGEGAWAQAAERERRARERGGEQGFYFDFAEPEQPEARKERDKNENHDNKGAAR